MTNKVRKFFKKRLTFNKKNKKDADNFQRQWYQARREEALKKEALNIKPKLNKSKIGNSERVKIGNIIKQHRKKAGLSQRQLGIKLGYKNGVYVSRWESGDKVPGARNLDRLAIGLNIPPSLLLQATRPKEGDYFYIPRKRKPIYVSRGITG